MRIIEDLIFFYNPYGAVTCAEIHGGCVMTGYAHGSLEK